MNIDYTNMTPAQAHFAGRVGTLLEYRSTGTVFENMDFVIEARPGEHLDLNVRKPEFAYAPIDTWLEHSVYQTANMADEGVWRVWPERDTVWVAGYDFETGKLRHLGLELPVAEDTGHPVMEVPEDWSDTAVHVALQLSGYHPESTLGGHKETATVFEALELDHPHIDRLALWVYDVEGHMPTLRAAIENAEDWAETEERRHENTYPSREEFAREWLDENERIDSWLMDCLDLEQVAEALLSDMTYTEGPNGEVNIYEI